MSYREAEARELARQVLSADQGEEAVTNMILTYGDRRAAEEAVETEVSLQGHDQLVWSEREGIRILTCGLCGGYFARSPETPEQRLYRVLKEIPHPILDGQSSFFDPCPHVEEEQ